MNVNRQLLIIALLGLVGASERVRQAVSALRDEPIEDDTTHLHHALVRLHSLFAPCEEHRVGDVSETLAALEGSLAGFVCTLAETTFQPALQELTLLESILDSSEAQAVLPLLQRLVDGLKVHACAN